METIWKNYGENWIPPAKARATEEEKNWLLEQKHWVFFWGWNHQLEIYSNPCQKGLKTGKNNWNLGGGFNFV